MKIAPKFTFVIALGAVMVIAALIPIPALSPASVSAHSGDVYSACGKATVDGNVGTEEWSGAFTQTFAMYKPGVELLSRPPCTS